ncbi:hypothetical protein [Micromonospora sp. URMC 103]|uniref:hypothetical protein n=1 Tax=Micromonospora sp. URMC 103 TaxID=3423406 RepID=UPI003F1CE4B6
MNHRIPLGDTDWWVWRDVVLRTAGFPAAGLAPSDAWVTDAGGRGYVSELRLQITDPTTYGGANG